MILGVFLAFFVNEVSLLSLSKEKNVSSSLTEKREDDMVFFFFDEIIMPEPALRFRDEKWSSSPRWKRQRRL